MTRAWRRLKLMLAISVRADPLRSLGAVLTATGQFVGWPIRALGLKLVANGIVAHHSSEVLTGALLMVVLTLLTRVAAWWSLNIRMRLRENTQLYLDTHLMGLVAGVPGVAHHELPEYSDRMELIRTERNYLANPFNPISWTLASVVSTITVFVLLGTVRPVLALLPLLGIPAAVASGRADNALEVLQDSQAEDNRRLRHLMELAIEPAAATEVRLFGLADEIVDRHHRLFARLEAARIRLATRNTAGVVGAWVVFGAAYALAIAWVIHLARSGATSVGSVLLVLSLGAQMNVQLAELGWNVAWLVRTYRAIGRLVWLSDFAGSARAAVTPVRPLPVPDTIAEGIRFEGVTFAYPGTDRVVLKDVDLVVPRGATVAVVGENGAGKTTLAKLLVRLYEPTAGRITLDGVDLRAFDIEEWRDRISAGFQDFARFELLARETVGVGFLPDIGSREKVSAALYRGAAEGLLEGLPDGLDTQLGREFEGAELSIGQWQKAALGRAMMREAPLLLLLDEPTASLDAPTEHRLFERYAGAARAVAESHGGVTILVSHRFSTVRMADLIVVIGGGEIRELGDHDRLMDIDGQYAQLYRMQARGYR
jgi:ATP-binding cassette, subfamily B, bacterial